MNFFEHVRNQLRNWSEANITFANHIDAQIEVPKRDINLADFAIFRFLTQKDMEIRSSIRDKQLK